MIEETSVAALGRLPSGLFIVTVRNGEAETGMLASWVQQCSFEPPQITMALKQGRPIDEWLTIGSSFVVNIIGEGQTQFTRHFGKGFAPDEPAFEGLSVDRSASAPVLTDSLAFLDCQIVERVSAGDHDLIVAKVVGGRMLTEGKPIVHIRKSGAHY